MVIKTIPERLACFKAGPELYKNDDRDVITVCQLADGLDKISLVIHGIIRLLESQKILGSNGRDLEMNMMLTQSLIHANSLAWYLMPQHTLDDKMVCEFFTSEDLYELYRENAWDNVDG